MSLLIETIARRVGPRDSAVALSDGDAQVPYGALFDHVQATAGRLNALCPGRRPVALCADNSVAWALIDLAAVLDGRPLVPLPAFMSEEQRRFVLAHSGAEWLVSDATVDSAQRFEAGGRTLGVTRLSTPEITLPAASGKITYTSGTTGTPKGVCLSQDGMEAVALSLVAAIGRHNAGIHLAVLPLAVLLENVGGLYATLIAGGHYRALPQAAIGFARPFQPDFPRLAERLVAERVATAIMVPEILRGTTAAVRAGGFHLPDLKFLAVGGATVPEVLLAQARGCGLPVFQGYGLSEAASVVTLNTPSAARADSVGLPLAHVALHLADDGEIVVSNPAFLGYVGGEPAPRTYYTGDIGRIDADGYVYVEGRKTNTLITSFGRNVAPEWVEAELEAPAEIRQAMVFGDGKPGLGALLVPSSQAVTDAQLTAAVDTVNARLPAYARIKGWRQAAPFTPQNQQLTANGRLRRPIIYRTYEDSMEQILRAVSEDVTFLDRLAVETDSQRSYLLASEPLRRGLAGDISLATYLSYLAEAYHHVRHTVPLMQLAKRRLPPGREWLAGPLDDYIAEETGHEEWILNDIRAAGGDAEAVRHGRPRMATEFMVAYAYDFINRVNAVGLFGMVYVLEGTSTQLATAGAEALMTSLGLTADCFSYLTSHGSLDIEHMKFFEAIMAKIDCAEDRDAIVWMAQRMFVLFANVFRAIPLDEGRGNGAL